MSGHRAPEPHYSLTIPSIHDDTTLNCRIYHPQAVSKPRAQYLEEATSWRTRGIIMAHPYAPMGGCYEDRVVGIVVEEFLALGYFVGTFNFRGAHGSKGRTSWSGRPELDDYTSFAGFFIHYLCHLHPFPAPDSNFPPDSSPASPQTPTRKRPELASTPTPPLEIHQPPAIVLGGYSYGSLILRHLPAILSLLNLFSAPADGCAASEILLRAHKLSDQSNLEWINIARDHLRQNSTTTAPRKKSHEPKSSLSVAMGGEETSPTVRRSSREIRRSIDRGGEAGGRSSGSLGRRMRSLSHLRRRNSTPPSGNPGARERRELGVVVPEVRYLLISPLMSPLSTMAATGLGHKFWNRAREAGPDVLVQHPALAVYGDRDGFTAANRVRQWIERLRNEPVSKFKAVEIENAGHFWHEHGVEGELREALKKWGAEINIPPPN
ncbi:Alpha/Beta hydrolase protein [Clohesyomyces aquaticus]|uniref:Alpha/Beta hydrolase protein n=1 Tax=Clohesyomyces aquaticus TaxID=1231657 RepID=A0A1Y2AC05_9PLEO|nr:Alpha/Beta hydrolase protein [Clohesyomyces aquaticus]